MVSLVSSKKFTGGFRRSPFSPLHYPELERLESKSKSCDIIPALDHQELLGIVVLANFPSLNHPRQPR